VALLAYLVTIGSPSLWEIDRAPRLHRRPRRGCCDDEGV